MLNKRRKNVDNLGIYVRVGLFEVQLNTMRPKRAQHKLKLGSN